MDICFPDYSSYFSLVEQERLEEQVIRNNLKALHVVLVQQRWDVAQDMLLELAAAHNGSLLATCHKTEALLCDDDIRALPLDIVKLICATDPAQADYQRWYDGRCPLMQACISAPTDVVLFLIDTAPHILRTADHRGDLPFHYGLLWRRSPKILTKMLSLYPAAAYVEPSFDMMGEWEHELERSSDGSYRDLPPTHCLDGDDDMDGLDRMKATFHLLTRVHGFGTVSDDNDDDTWLPVHEASKIDTVPPVCLLFLLRTMSLHEGTKHDGDGNFLLHNAANNKAWIIDDDDEEEYDDDYSDDDNNDTQQGSEYYDDSEDHSSRWR